jgi:hypothetical protein
MRSIHFGKDFISPLADSLIANVTASILEVDLQLLEETPHHASFALDEGTVVIAHGLSKGGDSFLGVSIDELGDTFSQVLDFLGFAF